jgi:hypothetical protein
MPLVYIKRYSRQMIQSNREWIFVFGDNFERRGLRGQAKEARGEWNAIGIATKHKPAMTPDAYLKDSDLDFWRKEEDENLTYLKDAIETCKLVVWPVDGIGTGLADLPNRAPLIDLEIQNFLRELEALDE